MAKLLKLKKYSIPSDGGDLVEVIKPLLLNMNAGLAIKLKTIGFDVYASLDEENAQLWIASVITDNEAVVRLAETIWQSETDIAEYLDSDGIDLIRIAFLEELKNFMNPHSRKRLELTIEETSLMAKQLAEKTETELRKVMGDLRKRILEEIPVGKQMVEKAHQAFENFRQSMLGDEPIPPSEALVDSL